MNKRKRRTFTLTISALAAALALGFLTLAAYSPFGNISLLALSAVALLLPLTIGQGYGCLLAYIAAGGLGVLCVGNPLGVLPFVLLFGLQPVIMALAEKWKNKWYISLPVKALHFNLALWGISALYGFGNTVNALFAQLNSEPIYWVIAVVGTLLWLCYDYMMQMLLRWLKRRLHKVVARYGPAPKQAPTQDTAAAEDPFAELSAPSEPTPPEENTESKEEKEESQE